MKVTLIPTSGYGLYCNHVASALGFYPITLCIDPCRDSQPPCSRVILTDKGLHYLLEWHIYRIAMIALFSF